jgi:hypothetical protein
LPSWSALAELDVPIQKPGPLSETDTPDASVGMEFEFSDDTMTTVALTIRGGSRRSSREASHASGRSSTSLPVDDGVEEREVSSLFVDR